MTISTRKKLEAALNHLKKCDGNCMNCKYCDSFICIAMEKYINGGLIMLNKKITKVLGNNEVKLSEKYEAGNNEFCHDVEFYSDAGEDVVETVFYDGTSKDFVRAFKEMADDFDADEHAEMWIDLRGKRGVPDSIRVLINDADSIKEFLLKVADELEHIDDDEEE